MKRIKMKTNASGPNGHYFAHRIYKVGGEIPKALAAEWLESNNAFECDEDGAPIERAVQAGKKENAMHGARETAGAK